MEALPSNWVKEIFKRFHGRFGNRFLAEYSSGKLDSNGQDEGIENAKYVWGEELAGFTAEEIKRGLSAQYSFLPDCDKFKLACRPTIDYEQAFVEAVMQMHIRKAGKDKWSNPAIYWAAAEIGNDLNNHPYQSIRARWKSAFDKAREKIADGRLPDTVPERLVALPVPGKVTVSKEEAAVRFAEARAILERKIINN
ncbi:MAG: hypothetical protein K2Q45_04160 [Nitrosomonas sp.]|nr:hypothetical protein [Nitrosomonas sp.]